MHTINPGSRAHIKIDFAPTAKPAEVCIVWLIKPFNLLTFLQDSQSEFSKSPEETLPHELSSKGNLKGSRAPSKKPSMKPSPSNSSNSPADAAPSLAALPSLHTRSSSRNLYAVDKKSSRRKRTATSESDATMQVSLQLPLRQWQDSIPIDNGEQTKTVVNFGSILWVELSSTP